MNLRKSAIVCLFVFISSCFSLFAQAVLPKGYGGIKLGMSVEEVKDALTKNAQFGYRGERDVSLLPGENRVLIQTDASLLNPYSYLVECYFQFYEGKLYIITINVNRAKMDYYSIFSQLCSKYGNPQKLSPEKSEWKDDSVMMDLEKPLSIKYTDKKVFDALMEASMVQESAEEITRENFLNGF